MQADFMKMPFTDNSFDAVYAIEATCHAPDAVCDHFSYSCSLPINPIFPTIQSHQLSVVVDAPIT